MPKIAIVIPARYASVRFPGKPLFPLAGKPMIQHVWERCHKAKGIDQVIVATDDMRIAEAAFSFGAEVSLTSPKCQSGTDRVAEVASRLKGFTHMINVQGDEPMVDPATITKLAKAMTSPKKVEMVTAASVFGPDDDVDNPNAVKVVIDQQGDALYFSRSRIPFVRVLTPGLKFYRHQGIYGYSLKVLFQFVKWKPTVLEQTESLEQLRALQHGVKIRVIEVKDLSVGVDTPADAAAIAPRLEALLRTRSRSR